MVAMHVRGQTLRPRTIRRKRPLTAPALPAAVLLVLNPVPDLIVHPAKKPLTGSVPVPGDKSIAHRAILLAGLASGTSRVTGGSLGEDNISTLGALRAMGIQSAEEE